MPSLKECQRIKKMNHELEILIFKYKGTFCSEEGNHALDALDDAELKCVMNEQLAFDKMRSGK